MSCVRKRGIRGEVKKETPKKRWIIDYFMTSHMTLSKAAVIEKEIHGSLGDLEFFSCH